MVGGAVVGGGGVVMGGGAVTVGLGLGVGLGVSGAMHPARRMTRSRRHIQRMEAPFGAGGIYKYLTPRNDTMEVEAKSRRLLGRRIALGVTGSIAAIEAPKIARELLRHGAVVKCYMTPEARRIIHPNAMEFATQEDVVTRLTGRLEHLEEFDLVLIAPATATTISKIVKGIADTPVTALALSTRAKVVIAPAMHDSMYENPIFKENMERLKALGYRLVDPRFQESRAKLAGIDGIVDACIAELTERELEGKRVLVTAGPTIEYLDPVRILTIKSSG